jgi:hypothetical protein
MHLIFVSRFCVNNGKFLLAFTDLLHSYMTYKNYKGFSGMKSFGEHLNNFASSFKWPVLYFAMKFGLSIWPMYPFDSSRCKAISS